MTEDVSSSIRLGITIIVVAALVATVLNVIFIAQSAISSGVSKFTSGVDSFNKQEFNKYDQVTNLHGSDVKAAIAAYADQDVAICVATTKNGTTFVNYDALLEGSSGGSGRYTMSLALSADGATYTAELQADATTGTIVHNKNRTGINSSGSTDYILDNGKFKANLIISDAGDIVGVAFVQIGTATP